MELRIENLCKSYEKKQVINDASFTFEAGKIYGLLGRNGAGITFLICSLLSSWMVWPMVVIGFICLIQAISFLCMSDKTFAEKYH